VARDPGGCALLFLGLNHIDPSPLRYEANGDLWQSKYGNAMERWLKEAVAPDCKPGASTASAGRRKSSTRGLTNHRHSRAFTFEEYQWLGLPYCHQLPFADFHQWEADTAPGLQKPRVRGVVWITWRASTAPA